VPQVQGHRAQQLRPKNMHQRAADQPAPAHVRSACAHSPGGPLSCVELAQLRAEGGCQVLRRRQHLQGGVQL
jgi:hypothetical protein